MFKYTKHYYYDPKPNQWQIHNQKMCRFYRKYNWYYYTIHPHTQNSAKMNGVIQGSEQELFPLFSLSGRMRAQLPFCTLDMSNDHFWNIVLVFFFMLFFSMWTMEVFLIRKSTLTGIWKHIISFFTLILHNNQKVNCYIKTKKKIYIFATMLVIMMPHINSC